MSKEELKNVGELFKKRREEMNHSLKEVANATSIRMNYLYSIESGEVGKLISPVYAQGFIKQYASFLGLDGEQILRDHPGLSPSCSDLQDFSYGIGTVEVRGNPGGGVRWLPNALWILAFGGLLFLAWYAARFLEVV